MKKEIKPVLLWVDQIEFDKHLHLIQKRLIPILNKIKVEFLKLEIGQMDNEFLEDILFGKFKLIKEKLIEQINEEAPSKFIKEEAINAANKMLRRLWDACEEIKHPGNSEFSVVLDFISVDEAGTIVLNDNGLQSLKDFHSKYCITEKGIELLEAHKAAAEALNKFFQLGKANIGSDPSSLGELFDFDSNENIIPSQQEYDWYLYARQAKSVAK